MLLLVVSGLVVDLKPRRVLDRLMNELPGRLFFFGERSDDDGTAPATVPDLLIEPEAERREGFDVRAMPEPSAVDLVVDSGWIKVAAWGSGSAWRVLSWGSDSKNWVSGSGVDGAGRDGVDACSCRFVGAEMRAEGSRDSCSERMRGVDWTSEGRVSSGFDSETHS